MVLVVHHAAIGGGVDPAAVGIAHDHEIVGAHVAAAVLLVQERHREFQQVDGVVAIEFSNTAPVRTVLGGIGLCVCMRSRYDFTTSSGQDGTGRPM